MIFWHCITIGCESSALSTLVHVSHRGNLSTVLAWWDRIVAVRVATLLPHRGRLPWALLIVGTTIFYSRISTAYSAVLQRLLHCWLRKQVLVQHVLLLRIIGRGRSTTHPSFHSLKPLKHALIVEARGSWLVLVSLDKIVRESSSLGTMQGLLINLWIHSFCLILVQLQLRNLTLRACVII